MAKSLVLGTIERRFFVGDEISLVRIRVSLPTQKLILASALEQFRHGYGRPPEIELKIYRDPDYPTVDVDDDRLNRLTPPLTWQPCGPVGGHHWTLSCELSFVDPEPTLSFGFLYPEMLRLGEILLLASFEDGFQLGQVVSENFEPRLK